MSPSDTQPDPDCCAHGKTGAMELFASRIAELGEGGFINFFQCAACGEIEQRDVRQQSGQPS